MVLAMRLNLVVTRLSAVVARTGNRYQIEGAGTSSPLPAWLASAMSSQRSVRARRLLIVALTGVLAGMGVYGAVTTLTAPRRTTAFYDPPVLAGQVIPGFCSGGVYARHGQVIVLTSSPHCGEEGTVVNRDATVQGVVGAKAKDATCRYPDHSCASSDLNYIVVAPDRIPWGHLNVIDLGTAGYRIIAPGTKALSCADIAVGDQAEVDGRNYYRTGRVLEKGENLSPPDQDSIYFPCMITSDLKVGTGDSGGVVLVRGIPAGVTSRAFGGQLGFTPLAEGLAQLGLELCTEPDCGLSRPAASAP
jgi:hypothetical protein